MAASVFKKRNLAEIPAGATIEESRRARVAVWTVGDGRERRRPVVSSRGRDWIVTGESTLYYGKQRLGPGRWKTVKLFVDKVASERRLAKLKAEYDQRTAAGGGEDVETLQKPITELRDQYIATLKTEGKDADHIRISEFMLNKLIELGGWRFFRHITRDSMERILEKLEAQAKTVSYRNKFIIRAKAFVHHFLPEGWIDPLRKLKRISEKGAKRTRARTNATSDQLVRLLKSLIPEQRRLAYALAGLNGLRRNEVEKLRWSHLHLSAPIPFVELKQKMGEKKDHIPLHPYLVRLLSDRMALPATPVVRHVPDVATLKKDWKRISVEMVNHDGERLDYHALRHTFQSNLDQTGCSRATKKKLMRHAAEDVTDGYAHAELAEMLTALQRLPAPGATEAAAALKTGTNDAPATVGRDGPVMDQAACHDSQSSAATRHDASASDSRATTEATSGNVTTRNVSHAHAATRLNNSRTLNTVASVGPSTQVD